MQTHLRNALLISSVFLVIALNFPTVQSASILDEIKGSSNSIVKMVQSLCLTSENCNREFFNLDNYCCNTGHCCNIVKYVLENDEWVNFKKKMYELPFSVQTFFSVLLFKQQNLDKLQVHVRESASH